MKKNTRIRVICLAVLLIFSLLLSSCAEDKKQSAKETSATNISNSTIASTSTPTAVISPTSIPEDVTSAPISSEVPKATNTPEQTANPNVTESPKPTDKPKPDDILSYLPKYTYSGVLAGTYDMSASGMYYSKGSKTEYDPLLKGTAVVDNLGGGKMWVYTKVNNTSDINNYAADLAKAGYVLYAQSDFNNNLFSTWTSKENVVTLSYLASRKEFSILIEPMRDLPGLEKDNVYVDKKIQCKAILAPTSHTGRENGLCLIYQLCDGSYIIVDGGHGIGFYPHEKQGFEQTYDDNAEEIYQILYNLAPDKKNIVIAAWFFTHPHWDHIGAVGPFADLYADKVKVEKVILNHPNNKTIQEMWDQSDANILYVTKMQNAFAKFKNAKIIEAHAGQVFYIRNAVINVLSTWEIQTQYNSSFESVTKMNSASLILDVTINNERTIVLGDSGDSSTAYLNKLYGTWIKADMVTVAHHGYQGANSTLYKNIEPDIVLWPINKENITSLLNEARNQPLKDADKIWVTGKSITIVPLPYTNDADVIVFEAPVLAGKTWNEVYPK
ncbi:MAG: MBL fold metallo-hydrolase [Clostridia bacterium]|nr:MBL fold metallo-hydrolase [Clostridia bacterium]